MEYVDARLPVKGVSVKVIVYGNDEAVVTALEAAAWPERAADVPLSGFEDV